MKPNEQTTRDAANEVVRAAVRWDRDLSSWSLANADEWERSADRCRESQIELRAAIGRYLAASRSGKPADPNGPCTLDGVPYNFERRFSVELPIETEQVLEQIREAAREHYVNTNPNNLPDSAQHPTPNFG